MNYMPKVLEMLGVGVGEKFNIKDVLNNNPFSFNDEFRLVGNYGHEETILLKLILNGEMEIEKLPWKPKEGDLYHCVLHNNTVVFHIWSLKWYDYYCYNSGNCFRTAEEITDEIKQRILHEMKGKYENAQ